MNDVVLKELIQKWKRDAVAPDCMDGSQEAREGNALAKGVRIGLQSCASDLHDLIKLLGDLK